MFSLHVPVTKIVTPRVLPALARLASVALMLPPLPQSTLIGAAYTVDVATKSTTIRRKMLPSAVVLDFMFFSSLLGEWRFGLPGAESPMRTCGKFKRRSGGGTDY